MKAAKFYKERKAGVSNYGVIDPDRGFVDCQYTACHYGLNLDNSQARGTKPIAVVNSIQTVRTKTPDIARTFIEWLVNYSPYQEIFLYKDMKQVYDEHNVLVTKVDVPSNLLVGGLVAARAMSEYADVANTWYEFVQEGCHPDVAFMYAHWFGTFSGRLGKNMRQGHTALDGYQINDTSVVNYMTGNRTDQDLWSKTHHYGGIHTTWGKANPKAAKLKIFPKIDDVWNSVALGKDKVVKSSNPFAVKPAATPGYLPLKEGIRAFTELFEGYKGVIA